MTMTLEQVRDFLRERSEFYVGITPSRARELADAIDAHLTQPAQSVDVEKVREVIAEMGYDRWGCPISLEGSQKLHALADKLTAALQEKSNG